MTLVQLALMNLRRRPARSALTVAAIAIGIAAIVSLTSIAWGFEASWQRANDARGTDLIVTRRASENPLPPMFVFGWSHGSFLWRHLELLEGRWPRDDSEPAVALGTTAAGVLRKKPGDSLTIEGTALRVVGLYRSEALVENGAVLMSLGPAQRLNDKPGRVNILNLKLRPGAGDEGAARVRQALQAAFPGFSAFTSAQLVQQNALMRITKAMSAATTLIAGLVGALGVFNTMLMSVSERTREIGVLLAIGWRRARVIGLVLIESVALALAGALALALALGLLGGLYPAWRAARLSPAAAWRHE